MFLQNNNVYDMEQLAAKIARMFEQVYEISNEIKAVDRRLDTLTIHLEQYDIYKKHQAVYNKYKQHNPKKRDSFYDKHCEEVQAYETASKYLNDVLNGRTEVPIHSWRKEQEVLTRKRFNLCETYYQLKDDTKDVEVLRRNAERLIQESDRERNAQRRTQNIDL